MAKNKLSKRQTQDKKEIDDLMEWSRGDYIRLGKAVANFNRKVQRIETKENMAYLPDLLDYQYVKRMTSSRSEYDRILNHLKDFQKDGQEKLMKLPSGMYITKWEKQFAKENINFAKERLRKKRDELREKRKGQPFDSTEIVQIKDQLKALQGFNTKWGYEFKRLKRRAFRGGRTDWELTKAKIFRENYYAAMEDITKFKNYKVFKDKLDSIKNPIEFYKYIEQNDFLADLFVWYKDEAGAYAYGGYADNEDGFNKNLIKLGLIKG